MRLGGAWRFSTHRNFADDIYRVLVDFATTSDHPDTGVERLGESRRVGRVDVGGDGHGCYVRALADEEEEGGGAGGCQPGQGGEVLGAAGGDGVGEGGDGSPRRQVMFLTSRRACRPLGILEREVEPGARIEAGLAGGDGPVMASDGSVLAASASAARRLALAVLAPTRQPAASISSTR